MNEPGDKTSQAVEAFWAMIAKTRERELDCDQSLNYLAGYLDQSHGLPEEPDGPDRQERQELEALMQHHQEICPECAEELEILRRALGWE